MSCVSACEHLREHWSLTVSAPVDDFKTGRDLLRQLVAENYPMIARGLLRPLLHLLNLSRAACGGDVDKFLIMLVIAIRTTEHEAFARYSQAELLSGEVPVFPTLGTNVRSIAESTGTPKETVRRKVGELVDTGWISRKGNDLRFTALAYQQLAGVRVAIEDLAVSNFEVVIDLARQSAMAGQRR
jgi:CRP-like cAMP-binding protein